jgi:hypothetical protein
LEELRQIIVFLKNQSVCRGIWTLEADLEAKSYSVCGDRVVFRQRPYVLPPWLKEKVTRSESADINRWFREDVGQLVPSLETPISKGKIHWRSAHCSLFFEGDKPGVSRCNSCGEAKKLKPPSSFSSSPEISLADLAFWLELFHPLLSSSLFLKYVRNGMCNLMKSPRPGPGWRWDSEVLSFWVNILMVAGPSALESLAGPVQNPEYGIPVPSIATLKRQIEGIYLGPGFHSSLARALLKKASSSASNFDQNYQLVIFGSMDEIFCQGKAVLKFCSGGELKQIGTTAYGVHSHLLSPSEIEKHLGFCSQSRATTPTEDIIIFKQSTWTVLPPDTPISNLGKNSPLVMRIEEDLNLRVLNGASTGEEAAHIVNHQQQTEADSLNPKKRLVRSTNTAKELLSSLKNLQRSEEGKLVRLFPAFCLSTLTGKNLVRCIGYVEPGDWTRTAYALVFQSFFLGMHKIAKELSIRLLWLAMVTDGSSQTRKFALADAVEVFLHPNISARVAFLPGQTHPVILLNDPPHLEKRVGFAVTNPRGSLMFPDEIEHWGGEEDYTRVARIAAELMEGDLPSFVETVSNDLVSSSSDEEEELEIGSQSQPSQLDLERESISLLSPEEWRGLYLQYQARISPKILSKGYLYQQSLGVQVVPRLSAEIIYPSSREKQKVANWKTLLSHEMALLLNQWLGQRERDEQTPVYEKTVRNFGLLIKRVITPFRSLRSSAEIRLDQDREVLEILRPLVGLCDFLSSWKQSALSLITKMRSAYSSSKGKIAAEAWLGPEGRHPKGYINQLLCFDLRYTLGGFILMLLILRHLSFATVNLRKVTTDGCENLFSLIRSRISGSIDCSNMRDAFRTCSLALHSKSGSYEDSLEEFVGPNLLEELTSKESECISLNEHTGVLLESQDLPTLFELERIVFICAGLTRKLAETYSKWKSAKNLILGEFLHSQGEICNSKFVPLPQYQQFLTRAGTKVFQYTRLFLTEPNSSDIAKWICQIAEVRTEWQVLWRGPRFRMINMELRELMLERLLIKFSRTLLKDRVEANLTYSSSLSFRNSLVTPQSNALSQVNKWLSDDEVSDEEYDYHQNVGRSELKETACVTSRVLPARSLRPPARMLQMSPLLASSSSDNGVSDDEEFIVAAILGQRATEEGEPEYLVAWAGFPSSADSWEPVANLEDCEIFHRYLSSQEST